MASCLPEEINDNPKVLNIELGAGCGNFGKRFYAQCFLTDNDLSLAEKCPENLIDYFCDANQLPWNDDRFEKIILCNPYGYGFKDQDGADNLLSELGRVLVDGGIVIILANETNKWAAAGKIQVRLSRFGGSTGFTFSMESVSLSRTEYQDFEFRQTSGALAYPNQRTTLHVTK